jgi:hypothetical protein
MVKTTTARTARDSGESRARYQGRKWINAKLPVESETWPKFSSRALRDLSGDDYDLAREDLRGYCARPWRWPERPIYFLCDVHADADAFANSLVATGGIAKTGPCDADMRLTSTGRDAAFIIGGDCFDKGPNNLRLLRAVRLLMDTGADVELLAGNHDVRTFLGLANVGSSDPRVAHLFARTGKKTVKLFTEIWSEYLEDAPRKPRMIAAERVRRLIFPSEQWYAQFPSLAAAAVPKGKIDRELERIREKVAEIEQSASAAGLTLPMLYAAVEKARTLFLHPNGEFHWLLERMKLAARHGSFLFIHAGVDDAAARVLLREGVAGLNQRFQRLMASDHFELYHGMIGNAFRTKYRPLDRALTPTGVADLHEAEIHAIIHGHQSIRRGQRIALRAGMLNFECDASVDRNTRANVGLTGVGGAALVVKPNGCVLGISTDYSYIKSFDAAAVCSPEIAANATVELPQRMCSA